MSTITPPKQPKSRTKKRLTAEQHAERQHAQRQRLQQAVELLQSSEGWARWLTARRLFRTYSARNQWLILTQRPTATRVAGLGSWKKLGYRMRQGEGKKGPLIFGPRLVAERDDHDEPTGRKRCIGFIDLRVYDVTQVEPIPGAEPLPLRPPAEPITGDSHKAVLGRLRELATSIGFAVETRDLSNHPASGWCDSHAKRIVIDSNEPANSQVRTLVHEIAHSLGVGYEQFGRCQAEVIVDAVVYCVTDTLGLDVSGETIPYVTGWGSEHTVEYLRTHAELIDTLARQIEDACLSDAPSSTSAAAPASLAPMQGSTRSMTTLIP